ncbi:MAG: alpha/beta hydrolase [Anaerolineae bacterium]|nr:alpha/beta hydrolase [Anaerolineae bacterium]MCO5194296.1 alpha/beta hydrolase [Anaerolineae bacterium]
MLPRHNVFLLFLVVMVWLAACGSGAVDSDESAQIGTILATESAESEAIASPSATTIPTATPEPTNTPRPTRPPTPTPPPDLNYTDDERTNAKMQLYVSDETVASLPVLIIFHGSGVTKTDYRGMAHYFAQQGYAVLVPNYRVRNMAEDALCVLAWVQANADTYAFDLDRVAVFGHSLGAMPTTLAATVDDSAELLGDCPYPVPDQIDVKAAATFGGFFGDFTACGNDNNCLRAYTGFMGADSAELTAILDQIAGVPPHEWRTLDTLTDAQRDILSKLPLYWLDATDPPFLIMHRDQDVTVDATVAEEFAANYTAAGAQPNVLLLPGLSHNDPMNAHTDVFPEMADPLATFLAETLQD